MKVTDAGSKANPRMLGHHPLIRHLELSDQLRVPHGPCHPDAPPSPTSISLLLRLEAVHIGVVRRIRNLSIDFQKSTFAISGPVPARTA